MSPLTHRCDGAVGADYARQVRQGAIYHHELLDAAGSNLTSSDAVGAGAASIPLTFLTAGLTPASDGCCSALDAVSRTAAFGLFMLAMSVLRLSGILVRGECILMCDLTWTCVEVAY